MTRQEVYYWLGLPLIRNHSIITYQKGKSEMLKSISFKKLAVLSAGIAIVLSSCGLQNEASESSGDATAAGKTKNFALLADGSYCYDTEAEKLAAATAADQVHADYHDADIANGSVGVNGDTTSPWWIINQGMHEAQMNAWGGQVGGCPAPTPGLSAVAEASVLTCVTKEQQQQMIDGYTEQLARPLGGEVTEVYLATMQKGLDVAKATCTK
jgi:hypothetical protein